MEGHLIACPFLHLGCIAPHTALKFHLDSVGKRHYTRCVPIGTESLVARA